MVEFPELELLSSELPKLQILEKVFPVRVTQAFLDEFQLRAGSGLAKARWARWGLEQALSKMREIENNDAHK